MRTWEVSLRMIMDLERRRVVFGMFSQRCYSTLARRFLEDMGSQRARQDIPAFEHYCQLFVTLIYVDDVDTSRKEFLGAYVLLGHWTTGGKSQLQ